MDETIPDGELPIEFRGLFLTAQQAESLEKDLIQNPNDVSTRTQLVSYYHVSGLTEPVARAAIEGHILWLIKNSPESAVLGRPEGLLFPIVHPNGYPAGLQAWVDQLNAQPQNLKVLYNAAMYFNLNEREWALRTFQMGEALDPNDPRWPEHIGKIYCGQYGTGRSKGSPDVAAKALAYLEKAFTMPSDKERPGLLYGLAKMAVACNDLAKAKNYAEEILNDNQEDEEENWNFGNNVHHGNLILGRVALRSGDIEEAKTRLLKSGQTPGSPQLDSFGPNMFLAKELLEIGEKEVVLKYFDLCSKFWESHLNTLKDWTKVVVEGGIPDFGPNLRY
ncbi:MAG: hypothetical protein JWM11_7962 [Planctomycetaceae bacterium]|nr:hypothetical protein [Planctomycetaceae bacterium]